MKIIIYRYFRNDINGTLMSIKEIITVAALLGIFSNGVSQETASPTTMGLKTKVTINNNTVVYNKGTGKRMSPEEVIELIKNNPRVTFENQINEKGEITALVYDPDKVPDGRRIRDVSKRPRPKDVFPEFIFQTLNGTTIASKDLRGQVIILSFHLFLMTQYVNEKFFSKYDSIVHSSPVANRSQSIIVTASTESDCKKFLDQAKIDYPIVPNGNIFMEKYIITNMPSFILVNEDGTLGSYANSLQELKKILNDL